MIPVVKFPQKITADEFRAICFNNQAKDIVTYPYPQILERILFKSHVQVDNKTVILVDSCPEKFQSLLKKEFRRKGKMGAQSERWKRRCQEFLFITQIRCDQLHMCVHDVGP